MNLLPKTEGNRPRLACEIAAGSVVAGRSPAPGAPLTAVARVDLAEGAVVPGLKPGNVADRVATIAAVRRVLEQVGARPNARGASLTLVIPDGAVRVLLLDFDSLPTKLTESLPIVRFRLKKLVPFDTDDAMVTFQVMSSTRGAVRVLAVAIPRGVLSDYETVAREAGYEPGAVLPSMLAALAALPEGEANSLAVNIYPSAVTTAIVRNGLLMLHRTVELTEAAIPAGPPAGMFGSLPAVEREPLPAERGLLPLVDREDTAEEWAAQEPLPEFGRNSYADAIAAEVAVEDENRLPGAAFSYVPGDEAAPSADPRSLFMTEDFTSPEPAPMERSPYASPAVTDDLRAEIHNSLLTAPPAPDPFGESFGDRMEASPRGAGDGDDGREPPVHALAPDAVAEEIARAISVAVAYFEDVLSAPPEVLLSAGPTGAEWLSRTLAEQGLLEENGLRSRELVEAGALAAEATTAAVPRSLLAGVVGALRS